VPIIHGHKLRDALLAHNAQVVWVDYPSEGHGWALQETRVDLWNKVERFLQRHIGKP
jgi:dipeptidyl aminopeptidase/acylaminoacyl peptidase